MTAPKLSNFILLFTFSLLLLNCGNPDSATTKNAELVDDFMKEKHRPQFHFTPPSQWMNDPNGMFYYEGEYHLFYQHYPDSNVWGPMHWGHAVSKDLVIWQHLPIALEPDSLGYIFSGSAVVDWKNSSGFGSESNPPLIAIYTYHNMEYEQSGRSDYQSQGIAYSTDKGRSWTKYDQNPVLPNQGIKDFRDPKVFWYGTDEKWIMTLAESDHFSIYSSVDLKVWRKESDFGKKLGSHAGVWECPDLFEIKVEGSEETKWVLLLSINPGGPHRGSATQYFVGDFNGEEFKIDTEFESRVLGENAVWLDYGADNYAGVTWSDIPASDGRRLFIGWMSNWQYAQIVPTTAWRSAMTIPRSLELHRKGSQLNLHSKPVIELETIIGSSIKADSLNSETFLLKMNVLDEFTVKLANDLDQYITLKLVGDTLMFDRSQSGIIDFEDGFGVVHKTPVAGIDIKQLEFYVDVSSIEIFINDGEMVITELVFPDQPYQKIVTEGNVSSIDIRPIKSIW